MRGAPWPDLQAQRSKGGKPSGSLALRLPHLFQEDPASEGLRAHYATPALTLRDALLIMARISHRLGPVGTGVLL